MSQAAKANQDPRIEAGNVQQARWTKRVGTTAVLGALCLIILPSSHAHAQDVVGDRPVADVRVSPNELTIEVGDTVALETQPVDDEGSPVEAEVRLVGPVESLWMSEGRVAGKEAGEYDLRVQLFPHPEVDWMGDDPPQTVVPITVVHSAVEDVAVYGAVEHLYEGTTVRHEARPKLPDGSVHPDVEPDWESSDPSVATVDRHGTVRAVGTGNVRITATAGEVSRSITYAVKPFPAVELEISGGADSARTGDVLEFEATARKKDGTVVADLPVQWSHSFSHEDELATSAVGGGWVDDGVFVAEDPGSHVLHVAAGPLTDQKLVEVEERDVIEEIEVVGHGSINHTRTTDFWVFEGRDGRDYAITGSKDVGEGNNMQAYVWDVTDPEAKVLTDSIIVDARSVNDVKVSPDARYASMTREGASDRRNGVVLLDLEDPAHPQVAAEHTEGLTGGVHNSFPTEDYLFALSAGEKYKIIDVTDLENPENVGEFQYPGARIHDVWVKDGIAYSAQRPEGVIVVDVGNGGWGGSPEDPVLINTTGPMPEGGGFHAIFPYESQSADRFYLFIGDEIMTRDSNWALQDPWTPGEYRQRWDPDEGYGGMPLHTAGYIHVVDFTDPEEPEKVAKYHVPEYGSHNIWVEDDVLYQAYYEGGLRVVDVSGVLKGDLYRQGREIAAVKPADPNGFAPNATMVWSAMPHKGNIFLTDTNSGLWSVEVGEPERQVP